jgi:GAF domain-containing protein
MSDIDHLSSSIKKYDQNYTEQLRALLDTASDLSSKLDLDKLLASVLERAVHLLEVTGGELAIFNSQSKVLEIVASHNLGIDSVGTILQPGEGAMGMVAETQKPLMISDYQKWKSRSEKYNQTTARCVMVVPLLSGGQLVGALAAVHLDEDRLFDEDDLKLLNMFAPLAATAIENARIYEAEKQRADEQKALLDTMADLSSNLELNTLLTSVLQRAVKLLGVTGGELAIYNSNEEELSVVASHNLGMDSVGTKLKKGEGAMGRVAKSKESLTILDYQTWEGRSDKYTKTTVRSVLVVPLMLGNQLVGTLAAVHLEEERKFDKHDLDLLYMFAPLAATAIENARIYEAEKQRADEQKALLDTMADLSSNLELNTLLTSVLQRAVKLLEVTGGELAIYNSDEEELSVVASHNLGMDSVGTKLKKGEGAMGQVAGSMKPMNILDYQTWEGRSDKYSETTVRSVLVVPLLIEKKLVGTIAAVHLEEERKFDSHDLDLLYMFAPLAATAIENARLFEAEKRRADEQKALLDTMTDLSSKLELSKLLTAVLERAVKLLKVTGGELAIFEENKQELTVVASHNLGMDSVGTKLKIGEGAMGRVAKSQESLNILDYQTWEGRSDKYTETTVRSVLVVPLMIGNQLVGTFAAVHLEEERRFNELDLKLLYMFAPLAATAIENARLFNKTKTLLKEAEQRADELNRTKDQLVQQEKLASLGQLTAGIAHEIKNPLNFVNNFSEVSIELIEEAQEEVKQISSKFKIQNSELSDILTDIKANLSKIHEHGTRADAIVKSMLMHSRGGDGKMEPIPLNPLIKEYVNLAFHGMRAGKEPINVDIDLQMDESIGKVPLITEDFSRVILNVCNNAFDAMRSVDSMSDNSVSGGYKPKLSVRTHQAEGTVTIEIEDNGSGIPEDMKNKILQPFFTTKKGTQGTGLGLSISNDIVKAHGGEIDIKSNKNGTTIAIMIKNQI